MAFGVHMHLLAEQKKTEEFQKNTEQSKAETDGGLRDDAATSIQARLAKANKRNRWDRWGEKTICKPRFRNDVCRIFGPL